MVLKAIFMLGEVVATTEKQCQVLLKWCKQLEKVIACI